MGNREQQAGLFTMPNDPKIPDLFRVALRGLQLTMRTHTVCTVTAYNPATQKVSVLVDILSVMVNNAVPPTRANPLPTTTQKPITLIDIPVAFTRTAAGYSTLPIVPGDKGELHVQDRSLDAWLDLGTATDPVAAWTHNLADSIFHPAIFNDTNPIVPPTSLTHHVIEGPLIALGALATSLPVGAPLVRGTELAAAFTTYTATVATAGATHAAALPPNPVTNAAYLVAITTATATLAGTIASWLSVKTFTE